MNSREAARLAVHLFGQRPPFMIVIALGANDVGSNSIRRGYAELAGVAAGISPRLLSISETSDEKPTGRLAPLSQRPN